MSTRLFRSRNGVKIYENVAPAVHKRRPKKVPGEDSERTMDRSASNDNILKFDTLASLAVAMDNRQKEQTNHERCQTTKTYLSRFREDREVDIFEMNSKRNRQPNLIGKSDIGTQNMEANRRKLSKFLEKKALDKGKGSMFTVHLLPKHTYNKLIKAGNFSESMSVSIDNLRERLKPMNERYKDLHFNYENAHQEDIDSTLLLNKAVETSSLVDIPLITPLRSPKLIISPRDAHTPGLNKSTSLHTLTPREPSILKLDPHLDSQRPARIKTARKLTKIQETSGVDEDLGNLRNPDYFTFVNKKPQFSPVSVDKKFFPSTSEFTFERHTSLGSNQQQSYTINSARNATSARTHRSEKDCSLSALTRSTFIQERGSSVCHAKETTLLDLENLKQQCTSEIDSSRELQTAMHAPKKRKKTKLKPDDLSQKNFLLRVQQFYIDKMKKKPIEDLIKEQTKFYRKKV